MNWNQKVWPLIFAVMIGVVIQVFATDDCGPCEDANDPSLVAAGWPPCIPKPGHGLKCGEPGEVERIPDVNYPIPDCGECPEVVESVTLGKCEESDDPCDVCTEGRRIIQKKHLFKCSPLSPEDLFKCRGYAYGNYRGTCPTWDACADSEVWDIINCLNELANDCPATREYLCELANCDCGTCVKYRVYRAYGIGCSGGL